MMIVIKRIVGFSLDLMIFALFAILINLIINGNIKNVSSYVGNASLTLFMLRDLIFDNGSPGKKIMGLRITYKTTKNIVVKKVFRNISNLIYPIDGIVLLIFKKRIGDFICGTDVVKS